LFSGYLRKRKMIGDYSPFREDDGTAVPTRLPQQTTAFVTAPIAFLAAAAFAVVLGSLIIGGREADSIALMRQRETIEHAINQHGHALGREPGADGLNEATRDAGARSSLDARFLATTNELFGMTESTSSPTTISPFMASGGPRRATGGHRADRSRLEGFGRGRTQAR
jgi:hypothetical protein